MKNNKIHAAVITASMSWIVVLVVIDQGWLGQLKNWITDRIAESAPGPTPALLPVNSKVPANGSQAGQSNAA